MKISNKLAWILICVLCTLIFIGCTSEKSNEATETSASTETTPAESESETAPPSFDICGLYGDGDTLRITKTDEGYAVEISILRLTYIDDGIGVYDKENEILYFTATDAAGSPSGGEIFRESENKVTLTFTDSTWEYLPNGQTFSFERIEDQTEHAE